mgnify:CR=1 FL=1
MRNGSGKAAVIGSACSGLYRGLRLWTAAVAEAGSLAQEDRREVGRRINEVFGALREAEAARRHALEVGSEDVLLAEDALDKAKSGLTTLGEVASLATS